jgi:hypothetical protein
VIRNGDHAGVPTTTGRDVVVLADTSTGTVHAREALDELLVTASRSDADEGDGSEREEVLHGVL